MKSLLVGLGLSLVSTISFAQSAIENKAAPGVPLDAYNEELGLPYWAPGRGEVDHDALRRRALVVLETQFSEFNSATLALSDAAIAHCDAGAPLAEFETAFKAAWIAWAPLDTYQFGPVEQRAAALTVNFWPDKKNFVGRGLRELLARPEAEQRDMEVIGRSSAAVQGLPALEMLMHSDAPLCPSAIGITAYLHHTAEALYQDWFAQDGWADLARAAGPDNPVYLNASEFTKTLYTALDFGLIRVADQRLGRPLGSFERSFPTRAEAWRTGLTDEIIEAQLDGIALMIKSGFAGDVRDPDRAWALKVINQAKERLHRIEVPIAEAVEDPKSRFRVEALQTKVNQVRSAMAEDIGPNLGVETGFSPADGD